MKEVDINKLFRAILVVLMLAAGFGTSALAAPTAAGGRPDIVMIVTDDHGYGDMSVHGHPVLRTPNLDRMHAGRTLQSR